MRTRLYIAGPMAGVPDLNYPLFNRVQAMSGIPVGTPVRFWPGLKEGEGRESVTRTPVWEVAGSPVVSVEGYAGGIALTHVEVKS